MAKKQGQDLSPAATRKRVHRRTTKSPGLLVRERELTAARRELTTLAGTGVANITQTARAKAAVKSAQRALKRQKDTARRQGRPTG